jgi:hypothetical protein
MRFKRSCVHKISGRTDRRTDSVTDGRTSATLYAPTLWGHKNGISLRTKQNDVKYTQVYKIISNFCNLHLIKFAEEYTSHFGFLSVTVDKQIKLSYFKSLVRKDGLKKLIIYRHRRITMNAIITMSMKYVNKKRWLITEIKDTNQSVQDEWHLSLSPTQTLPLEEKFSAEKKSCVLIILAKL